MTPGISEGTIENSFLHNFQKKKETQQTPAIKVTNDGPQQNQRFAIPCLLQNLRLPSTPRRL